MRDVNVPCGYLSLVRRWSRISCLLHVATASHKRTAEASDWKHFGRLVLGSQSVCVCVCVCVYSSVNVRLVGRWWRPSECGAVESCRCRRQRVKCASTEDGVIDRPSPRCVVLRREDAERQLSDAGANRLVCLVVGDAGGVITG